MNETKNFERTQESVGLKAESGRELFNVLERAGRQEVTSKEELKINGGLCDEFINGLYLYLDRVVKGKNDIAEIYRDCLKTSKIKGLGMDAEDFRQNLAIHILENSDHFLKFRKTGREMAYIHSTVRNTLNGWLKGEGAEIRDSGEVTSLDSTIGEGGKTVAECCEDGKANTEENLVRKAGAVEILKGIVNNLWKYADDLLVVIGVRCLYKKPGDIADDLNDAKSVDVVLAEYERSISEDLDTDLGGLLTKGIEVSKKLDREIRQPGSTPKTIVNIIYDIMKHKRVQAHLKPEGGENDE